MLKSREERFSEIRSNIRGGKGDIRSLQLFSPEETLGKCTVCTEMTMAPGDSIGPHPHGPDAEIYFVLEGELTVTENGVTKVLSPGDCSFTGGGDVHEAKNLSAAPVRFLAIVMK